MSRNRVISLSMSLPNFVKTPAMANSRRSLVCSLPAPSANSHLTLNGWWWRQLASTSPQNFSAQTKNHNFPKENEKKATIIFLLPETMHLLQYCSECRDCGECRETAEPATDTVNTQQSRAEQSIMCLVPPRAAFVRCCGPAQVISPEWKLLMSLFAHSTYFDCRPLWFRSIAGLSDMAVQLQFAICSFCSFCSFAIPLIVNCNSLCLALALFVPLTVAAAANKTACRRKDTQFPAPKSRICSLLMLGKCAMPMQ